MTLERAVEIFLEDVRALNKHWHAYNAVFSYPVEERLPAIGQPILLLQPNEMLLTHTRNAKRDLIPHAQMIEMLDVETNIFETGRQQFARHMREWLDHPVAQR